jgi:hypothetical protein
MMIKANIQPRIDGTYSLFAAEKKHGYKVGEFIKVVDSINTKITKHFFCSIKVKIEPKAQQTLF